MSSDFPRMPDPEEDEHPEPPEMRAIRDKMPYHERVDIFRQVFHREPNDDNELDEYIDELARELYNSGSE